MRMFAPSRKGPQSAGPSKSALPTRARVDPNHQVNSIPMENRMHAAASDRPMLSHRSFGSIPIFPKLAINQPGDAYEQEADRVANQVMTAAPSTALRDTPLRIQLFPGQASGSMEGAPATVDRTVANPGRPLEPALRQDMEQRFGHEFSCVRVHSDVGAAQSAREIQANAYTVGHNIVFAAGQFAPGTMEGRRLIAHELTHVAQQGVATRLEDRSSLGASAHVPTCPGTLQRQPGRIYKIGDNERFLKLAERMGAYGLPVRFMPLLAKQFTIVMNARGNETRPVLKVVDLTGEVTSDIDEHLPPEGKVIADEGLGHLYHELTHAFVENVEEDKEFARLVQEGTAYYTGAPLKKELTATDPFEVFTEAAAAYVENKVVTFWRAMGFLVKAGQGVVTSGPGPGRVARFLGLVDTRREMYDKDMTSRTFGYETVHGHQVETTKPIYPPLAVYLDEHILENKMPDHFDDVVAFKNFIDSTVQLLMVQGRKPSDQ